MRPCWMVYQLLLFFVLKGKTNEDYFGISGYSSVRGESHSVEPDFQIEFNPSSVLAFVPARSCHLQFRGDHGTFSPPVLYGNIDINLWCNWTVVASPGRHIVIYITGFQTNKTCTENNDEIIFEGISSSVESTIVYACWNKHTHVFATEASAVSVVLLWRSFSSIRANRYFDGKFYIFTDPALGPNIISANCSLIRKQNISSRTSKQNVSSSHVIRTPTPEKTTTAESRLYSVLAPFSSSTMFYSPSVPSPQKLPSVMETYSPTLTIEPSLTATTDEVNMLRVAGSLAQDLSSIYSASTSQLPAVVQSLKTDVYEGPKVQPTAGDLEPSSIGNWEAVSRSIRTSKTAQSDLLLETSSLILAHYAEHLDETHLGVFGRMLENQWFSKDQSTELLTQSLITPLAESISISTIHVTELQWSQHTAQMAPYLSIDSPTTLHEIPQFSTAHMVTFHISQVNVPKSQHLGKTDFIDPHFVMAHSTDPPDPSTYILNTDFLEPSLLSDIAYSSKIYTTKFQTSQLSIDPTIEQIAVSHFSIAPTAAYQETSQINEVNVPERQHLSRADFIEPPGGPRFVTAHAADAPDPSLTHILYQDFVDPSLLSDVSYSSKILTTKVETSQLSMDPTIEQIAVSCFSTAPTAAYRETSQINEANVPERQHLSRADFIEPPGGPRFVTAHATDAPEPSLTHILNQDFVDPSLLSDVSYSSKILTTKVETSQLSMDPTTKQIDVLHFGRIHAVVYYENSQFDEVHVSKSQHLSRTDFIEPPGDVYFVTAHATDPPEPSLVHLHADFLAPLLVTEIPYSSEFHTWEFTKTSQLSIDPTSEQVAMPLSSTAHAVSYPKTSQFNTFNERQHLNITDFIEPHWDLQFVKAHATDPPEPSLILNADFLEPSLVTDMSSKIHTSKFTKTSQLSIDPTYEQVTMSNFSTGHTITYQETSQFNKINVPESQNLSRTDFIEPPGNLHFVTAHTTDPPDPSLVLNPDFLDPLPVTDIPYSSKIHTTKFIKISQLSIDPTSEQVTAPHFSTAHTVVYQDTSQFNQVNGSQHLRRTDFTESSGDEHETEPPVILGEDFLDASLVTDIPYFSKFTETSQLSIAPTTKQVTMPHFSIAQTFELSKSLNVSVESSSNPPEIVSFSLSRYIEPMLSNGSTSHQNDLMESKPLNVTDYTKLPTSTAANNGDHLEMQRFSRVHTIGQSVFLRAFQKIPLTVNVRPNLEGPVSQYPWQVASSSPTSYQKSLTKSHVQSTSFTETYTSVLNDPVSPLQVSQQSILPSYGSALHPPLTPTKLLNEILDKNDTTDPDNIKSYPTSQIAPSSSVPSILSYSIRTSVSGLQLVRPTYWTTLEQPLDTSFPQSSLLTPDQKLMFESTVASRPTPEIPAELIYSKSTLRIAEKMDKMMTGHEYISSKSLETLSLPTIDYKVTRDFVEPTKELDWWTVKDRLEATDSISGISTQPTSTAVPYLSYSGELLISNVFEKISEDIEPQITPSQPYLQPKDNSVSNMAIATIELISEGKEKTTYSYQTHPELDLHQDSAGQARDKYFNEENVTSFFGNPSDLEFLHEPGDSLFVITMRIENKDAVLRDFEKDLIKSVREKITERVIYFPSGQNSLILKEIRWTNVNRVRLTFWLQLIKGGKEMRNFLRKQLKSLQSDPLGSSNATLASFTVEDLNECQLGIQICHKHALCVNMFGSYSCYCMDGYEDRSPGAPGTICMSSKPTNFRTLSEHLEILIGAIATVGVLLLVILIIVCIVHQKRRAKVGFGLQNPWTREHEAHVGGDRHGEFGQGPSSPTRPLSSRHDGEHHTATDESSTLELTKITVEQTAC